MSRPSNTCPYCHRTPQSWASTAQAAAIFEVSRRTVLNWVKQGRIPVFYTPGGHIRIRLEDVDRIVRSMQHDRKGAGHHVAS